MAVKCEAMLSTEFIYFRESCSMAISRILEALKCQSGDLKVAISRTAQSNYCVGQLKLFVTCLCKA